MRWNHFTPTDNMPIHGSREINYNQKDLVRPYETPVISASFMFSHGHFILNAGYSKSFDHVFNWEEPL